VPAAETFLRLCAVNDGGEAVGKGDRHAWLWRDGRLTTLPALPGRDAGPSQALAINDAGQIVGSSGGRAVMWLR
jgi:uncharacterized membrane protein